MIALSNAAWTTLYMNVLWSPPETPTDVYSGFDSPVDEHTFDSPLGKEKWSEWAVPRLPRTIPLTSDELLMRSNGSCLITLPNWRRPGMVSDEFLGHLR